MTRWLLAIALVASACGGAPAAPTPVIPSCQSQNTADLTLVNGSTNNLTYDVSIDGVTRGAMSPSQSRTFTLTAGVTHSVISRFTNTGITACSSTPSFIQCSTQTLTCRS